MLRCGSNETQPEAAFCLPSGKFGRKVVMNMTLTEVCALLGLLGGAIFGTYSICRDSFKDIYGIHDTRDIHENHDTDKKK